MIVLDLSRCKIQNLRNLKEKKKILTQKPKYLKIYRLIAYVLI